MSDSVVWQFDWPYHPLPSLLPPRGVTWEEVTYTRYVFVAFCEMKAYMYICIMPCVWLYHCSSSCMANWRLDE